MSDTVVIETPLPNVGYRFSWGLALAGGVAAAAVTFLVLTLGAGFGLLLVNPHTTTAPTFFTGGAIFFVVAEAFGFAVGGHIAGRLLGPLIETQVQEDIRACIHGLLVWAIAVLATLAIVSLAGLTAASTGARTAAIYGASVTQTNSTSPAAYLVDKLFRPGPASTAPSGGDQYARAEAARLVNAGLIQGLAMTSDDRTRLVTLVTEQAGIPRDAAEQRVSNMQRDIQVKTQKAADTARKVASYSSLWIAFSLLFGAVVAMGAAMSARIEDDRQLAVGRG